MPRWIKRGLERYINWSVLLQTPEDYWGYVSAVAFSPDGKQLASASGDKTVKVWDTAIRAMQQTLKINAFLSLHPTTVSYSSPTLSQPVVYSCGIFVQDEWIAYGADRKLWLPPDYRPSLQRRSR